MAVMPIAAEGPIAAYDPEWRPWVIAVGAYAEDMSYYIVMARSATAALERLEQSQHLRSNDEVSEPRLLAFDSELIAAVG